MNDPVSHAPHETPARPRRRRYPWILLAVLIGLAGLAAAAPALVSTPWGRSAALAWYNGSIPGEITVEDLSLSWLGGQSVRGLAVRDAGGSRVLVLQALTTELSLLEALRSRLSLGRTVARGLNADLRFEPDGTSNLSRALGTGAPADQGGAAGPVVPVTGNMTLVDSRIAISAPGIEPVVLDSLEGAVETSGQDAPIDLSFSGRSRQGELRGSITLDGTVSGLFTDGELTPASARLDIDTRVEDLPVDALDQLLNAGGLLSAALGDRASLTLRASGDASRQNLSIDARVPNGELSIEGVVSDNRFSLQKPSSARLRVTPALVEAVDGGAAGGPAFRLAAPVPLRMEIEQLQIPLAPFSLAGVTVAGELTAAEPVRFTEIGEIGDAALHDLRLRVDSPGLGHEVTVAAAGTPKTGGESGELTLEATARRLFDDAGHLQPGAAVVRGQSTITGIPTALLDTALGRNGLLSAAAGPRVAVDVNADTDEDGNVSVGLKLSSQRIQTDMMTFSVGEHLTLAHPARARLTATPDLWRRLAGEDAAYRLAQPAQLTVDVTNLRWPMPGGQTPALAPARTQVHATLAADPLVFNEARGGPSTRIEDLALDLAGGSLDALDLDLSGAVSQAGGTLGRLDASPLRVKLEAQTGVSADASLKRIDAALVLDSAGLKASLKTAVEEGFERLTLTEPATINAVITPALLAASQTGGGPTASLREPAAVEARLETMTLPLAPFDYTGVTTEGSARIEPLVIRSGDDVVSRIEDSNLTFSFRGSENGRAQLDAGARVRTGDGEPGELSIALTAGKLLDGGGWNSGGLSLELDGRMQHLPVALVDQWLATGGLAGATLGATADLDVQAALDAMKGPVTVSLTAPNARADIKARVGDDGLALAEPLVAQVAPTPAFGRQVLARIHPIFETLQRAEQPIRLEVPAEGVRVPVRDYDFAGVTVPRMTLDFGKLVLKSGWLLRGVIGLGQRLGKLDSVQKEEWPAWFTPGVLEVRDGKVNYTRRLDLLLADRLHLATWGSADVRRDQSNLTLAFMPDTLERVFSITVAGDDALRIPITGSLSSPSIDYKQAGAELARLRAREEVAGESSLAGALLGAVTGKDGAKAGPIPPASVTPLPWAGQLPPPDAAGTRQEPAGTGRASPDQAGQAQPDKRPSTEEQVIKGLIDIFGNKKKE